MALHALIIGLNEAQDRHLHPLRFACADARAIRATMADDLGHGDTVRLLEHPNGSAVRKALAEIETQVRAGDTFLLYFAGHGAQHGDEQFMLLHEADLVALERGDTAGNDLLALGALMRRVADWPAVQAAYILDACRTPQRRGGRTGAYSARVEDLLGGLVARGDFLLRRHRPGSADGAGAAAPCRPLVVNACGEGEQAYELEALGRGQFSHGFEQWLRDGVSSGQPRVLGRQAAAEIASLVDDAARVHRGRRGQRPWVPEACDEVLLWRPERPQQGSQSQRASGEAPAAPTQGIAGASAQALDERLWALAKVRAKVHGASAYEDYLLKAPEGAMFVDQALQAIEALLAPGGLVDGAPQPAAQPAPAPAVSVKREWSALRALTEFRDEEWTPRMVVIPAGRFVMGSPEKEPERTAAEGPQREVEIRRAFGLGRTVVTFDDYDRYAMETGLALPGDEGWGRGNRPVINVSWEEAQGYIGWLNGKLGLSAGRGYRLPTEAEWEYAARAGTKTAYWWGDKITPRQANYDGTYEYAGGGGKGEYRQKTVGADAFEANPWGLYNVHGNVWEWVQDGWHDDYTMAPSTEAAWEEGSDKTRRVVRGGSWVIYPGDLRSADRGWFAPDCRIYSIGFRLARTF